MRVMRKSIVNAAPWPSLEVSPPLVMGAGRVAAFAIMASPAGKTGRFMGKVWRLTPIDRTMRGMPPASAQLPPKVAHWWRPTISETSTQVGVELDEQLPPPEPPPPPLQGQAAAGTSRMAATMRRLTPAPPG